MRIDFFFDGSTQFDTDNIIKPIQDALVSVVYSDDGAVTDVCARKINLRRLPTLVDAPTLLSEALNEQPGEFVFIRIAGAGDRLVFA